MNDKLMTKDVFILYCKSTLNEMTDLIKDETPFCIYLY